MVIDFCRESDDLVRVDSLDMNVIGHFPSKHLGLLSALMELKKVDPTLVLLLANGCSNFCWNAIIKIICERKLNDDYFRLDHIILLKDNCFIKMEISNFLGRLGTIILSTCPNERIRLLKPTIHLITDTNYHGPFFGADYVYIWNNNEQKLTQRLQSIIKDKKACLSTTLLYAYPEASPILNGTQYSLSQLETIPRNGLFEPSWLGSLFTSKELFKDIPFDPIYDSPPKSGIIEESTNTNASLPMIIGSRKGSSLASLTHCRYLPPISEEKFQSLIKAIDEWDFYAPDYTHMECVHIAHSIFSRFNLFSILDIDEIAFCRFLLALKYNYHPNPYHNFHHAIDVLQCCYYLIHGSIMWRRILRPMDIFAIFIAALGHDVGHPSFNNAYWTESDSLLTTLFNDKAVLENMHCMLFFAILRHPRYNFTQTIEWSCSSFSEDNNDNQNVDFRTAQVRSRWSRAQWKEFRSLVVASILGTDMAQHFDYIKQFGGIDGVFARSLRSVNYGLGMGYDATLMIDSSSASLGNMTSSSSNINLASATGNNIYSGSNSTTGASTSSITLPIEDRRLLCAAVIKFADICNVIRPFDRARRWGFHLICEFFHQGDWERILSTGTCCTTTTFTSGDVDCGSHPNDASHTHVHIGTTSSPMTDRLTLHALAKGQEFFLNNIASPLYKIMAENFSELHWCEERLRENLECWRQWRLDDEKRMSNYQFEPSLGNDDDNDVDDGTESQSKPSSSEKLYEELFRWCTPSFVHKKGSFSSSTIITGDDHNDKIFSSNDSLGTKRRYSAEG